MTDTLTINGRAYDALDVAALSSSLREVHGYRRRDSEELAALFNKIYPNSVNLSDPIIHRLSRLAGTTLLEGLFILKAIGETAEINGDCCEFGVAHGRTSALLAQALFQQKTQRVLWLYDSFEGLPAPHEKDVLLHDIYAKGSMAAYEGALSFAENHVKNELSSVNGKDHDWFRIVKGWITPETLVTNSPRQISFAFLDMDFYQSTYDVLRFLVDRMPTGGVAILDDYAFFSSGIETAAKEILVQFPRSFSLEIPFNKFAILTRL
jgi:O-methyltransferase